MKLNKTIRFTLLATVATTAPCLAERPVGTTPTASQALQSRIRPIGSATRSLATTPRSRETSSRVQQAAYLQFGLGPESSADSLSGGVSPRTMPAPSQFAPAPQTSSNPGNGTSAISGDQFQPMAQSPFTPVPIPSATRARTTAPTQTPFTGQPAADGTTEPRTLPPNPSPASGMLSRADLAPMSQPKLLGGDYATVYNCPNVSAASPYLAGRGYGCGVAPASATAAIPYAPPPAQIASPAVMPPMVAMPMGGNLPAATGAPAGSLVTFGQETFPVQVGQGLWGQPVAYVPGQTIRNWLRYMSF